MDSVSKKRIGLGKKVKRLEGLMLQVVQDVVKMKGTLYGNEESGHNGFLKAYDDLDTRTIALYRLIKEKELYTEEEFLEKVEEVREETKAHIEAYMDARQGKRKKTDEELIEKGDELTVNVSGTCEGKGFPGDKLDGLMLLAGGDHPFEGFSDALIGKKNNDVVEFAATVPESCPTKDWVGKTIHYKVKVLCVKTLIVQAAPQPPISEEPNKG